MPAHILVVDDESQLVEVVREALVDHGLTVSTASNGLQALEVLESSPPVECMVTDVRMPHMNGLELLQEVSLRRLDVSIIFLTGYGTVENAVECMRSGASDYLLKPFAIGTFLEKIDKVLRERQLRQTTAGGNLTKMLSFSRALNGVHEPRQLVRQFLEQLKTSFAPEGLALYLSQNQGGPLVEAAVEGDAVHPATGSGRWLKSLATRLCTLGQPKLIDPMTMDRARSAGRAIPAELEGLSVMLAPIGVGAGCSGVIVLARRIPGTAYCLDQLHLLTIFTAHVATALESVRASRRLSDISLDVITSYVTAVEAKDFYTKGHSERVCAYAGLLGKELGLIPGDLEVLQNAAVLHDIGKIGIPDQILNKPGPFTPAEAVLMREHPIKGREIVSRVKTLAPLVPLIYHHHEWFNGKGYPAGLKGSDIPYLVRILSVVDGFEAMTSDRAYHRARTSDEALAILDKGAGEQWDPLLVTAWRRVVAARDVIHDPPPLPLSGLTCNA